MYLERILVRGFAGLVDLDLQLEEAYCYLEAPNAWGKSSLFRFILSALYGLPKARRGEDNWRSLYRPRYTVDYGGSLCLRRGGRRYRLDCHWGQHEREDCYVLEDLDRGHIIDLEDQLPGPYLLGLDREHLVLSLALDTDAARPEDLGRFSQLLLGQLLRLPGHQSPERLESRLRNWQGLLGNRRKESLGRQLETRYQELQARRVALDQKRQQLAQAERLNQATQAGLGLWDTEAKLELAEQTAKLLRLLEQDLGRWRLLERSAPGELPGAKSLPSVEGRANSKRPVRIWMPILLAGLGLVGFLASQLLDFLPQSLSSGLWPYRQELQALGLAAGLAVSLALSLRWQKRRCSAREAAQQATVWQGGETVHGRSAQALGELRQELERHYQQLAALAAQRGQDYSLELEAQSLEKFESSLQREWRKLGAWRQMLEAQLLRQELQQTGLMGRLCSPEEVAQEEMELEAEQNQLQRRFSRLQELEAELQTLQQWLQDQQRQLQENFWPQISERLQRYYQRYYEGSADCPQVLLNSQLEIQLRRWGQLWRPEQLSRSEAQLLSCFLRLALTEVLGQQGALPFIVDDHFVHLDQEYYQALLSVLRWRLEAGGLSQLIFLSWRPSPL